MSVRLSQTLPRSVALAFVGALALAPSARSAPPDLASPTVRTVQDAAAETGVLRRLPAIGRATRLTGEIDRLTWPVWLTAAEAASGPKLRLAHVAAVSVMPEASHLAVYVGDRSIGTFPIATSGTPRTVELTLPPGALRAGWNELRIEAEQRHRVECTTASTYELWTEIDRARSGLVFPTGFTADRRGLADIAGVAPDESGRIRLRLVTPQDPDPTRLGRALTLAQAVALAGGFLDPIVTVGRAPEKGPGIDILFGAQARALSDVRGGLPTGGVAMVDDVDPSRLTLAVPDDAGSVDRLVADLVAAAGPDVDGTEAGRHARAALGGLAVAGDETHTLAEFGATSQEFTGHLFRTVVDMRLPADLYAADYAKATLKLAGGHVSGLDRSSRMTVRVNGRQVAGTPLARQGEIFSDRQLKLPLSAFRPGHNRLEIEASLVHPDDRICDPNGQIDGTKRFLLLDRTELTFPTLARVAHLPDLAATAAGVFARLDGSRHPTIHVPHPDAPTLSALATLLTRTATAGGRIDVPQIVYRNPPADAPSALVVGAFSDLPSTVAGNVGIEPVSIRDAWSRRATPRPPQDTSASADRLLQRASALRLAALDAIDAELDMIVTGTLPARSLESTGQPDVVDRWRRSVESPWSPAAFVRGAGRRIEENLGPIFGAPPAPAFVPRATTGFVMAQALSADGGVWTLVTAPTVAALVEGATTLTEAERWNDLSGTVAAWDQVDEKLQITPGSDRAFFQTERPSPANLRLIAAGWVTDHPLGFVLAALVATLLLGFATARIVPHLGVRA